MRWLEEKERRVEPRTADFYREQVERYLNPRLGRVRLAKLTPLQIQTALGELADQISASTANKCRTTLYGALKQAVRWGLLPRNPVEAVEKLNEPKCEMIIWSPEEATRFLATAREHRLYPAFYLAMCSGLRRGEILGLRWQDLHGSTLHIRQSLIESRGRVLLSTPKTSKGVRRVALSSDVLEVLEHHRQHQKASANQAGDLWASSGEAFADLVFTNELGGPLHPRNFERTWYALQDETRARWRQKADAANDTQSVQELERGALFPRARFHDLRHLNVSIRRRMGQDAKLIADQIGHTDPAFTLRLYTHLFEDERTAAAIDLRQALGSAAPRESLN